MKKRIISALFMLPLLVFLYIGGTPLFILTLIISSMALYEFCRGFENIQIKPSLPIALTLNAALYAICYLGENRMLSADGAVRALLAWVFISVILSLCTLFNRDHNGAFDCMATLMSVFYISFTSCHIYLLAMIDSDSDYVWLAAIASLGTDAFAYFGGMAFGKHKLIERISPKKTVEGAVCGCLGSIVLCIIFGLIFFPHAQDNIMHLVIIGLAGSAAGQIGDLCASAFKRRMQIKDFGNLIPGHGGVLDRFDSMLLTAPVVFYYVTLIIKLK